MHVSIDGRHGGRLRKRDNLLTGKGVGQGKGAKSYDALYYIYIKYSLLEPKEDRLC